MIKKIIIGIGIIVVIFFLIFSLLYGLIKYRENVIKTYYKDDIYLYNLFHDINGFVMKSHDKYNLTYGEITPNAIQNMKKYLETQNIKPDIFIDLGCGAGKSLVMAKYKGFKECYGIELVRERYNEAIKLYNRLDDNYKKSIYIYNDDLFNIKDIIQIDKNRHYTIFISNLLFSTELNNKIWKYLNDIMPNGTIVIVSKFFTGIDSSDNINTPMSWSDKSKCYIYKIK